MSDEWENEAKDYKIDGGRSRSLPLFFGFKGEIPIYLSWIVRVRDGLVRE